MRAFNRMHEISFRLNNHFLVSFLLRTLWPLFLYYIRHYSKLYSDRIFGDYSQINYPLITIVFSIILTLSTLTIFTLLIPKLNNSIWLSALILLQSIVSPIRIFVNLRFIGCFGDQTESLFFKFQCYALDHLIIGIVFLGLTELFLFVIFAGLSFTTQVRMYLRGSFRRKMVSEFMFVEILVYKVFLLQAIGFKDENLLRYIFWAITGLAICGYLTSRDEVALTALLCSFAYIFTIVFDLSGGNFETAIIYMLPLTILLCLLKWAITEVTYSVERDFETLFGTAKIPGEKLQKFQKDIHFHTITCNQISCECQVLQENIREHESIETILPQIKKFYYNNQLKMAESGKKEVFGILRSCFGSDTIIFECDLMKALAAHKGFYHVALRSEIRLIMGEKALRQKIRFLHSEERFLPLLEKELSIQSGFFKILNILKEFSEKSFGGASVSEMIRFSQNFEQAVENTKKQLSEDGLPRKEILSLLLAIFFERESELKPQNILLLQNKMMLNVNKNDPNNANKIVCVFKHNSMIPIYSIGRVFPNDLDSLGRLVLIPKPFESIHNTLIKRRLPFVVRDHESRPFFLENEGIFKYISFSKRNFISSKMELLMAFNAISKQSKNSRHLIYGIFDQKGDLLTSKMRDKTKFKLINITMNQNYTPFFQLFAKYRMQDWRKVQPLLLNDISFLRECLLYLVLQIGFFDSFGTSKESFFLRFKVLFEHEELPEKLLMLEIISCSKFKFSKFTDKINRKMQTYIARLCALDSNIAEEINARLVELYRSLVAIKSLHGLTLLIEGISVVNHKQALLAIRAMSINGGRSERFHEQLEASHFEPPGLRTTPNQAMALRKNILVNLQRFTPRHFRVHKQKPLSKIWMIIFYIFALVGQITLVILRGNEIQTITQKEVLRPTIVNDSLHFMAVSVFSTGLAITSRIHNFAGNFSSASDNFNYWYALTIKDYNYHFKTKFDLFYYLYSEVFPETPFVNNITTLLLAFTNASEHRINCENFVQNITNITGPIEPTAFAYDIFSNLTYFANIQALDNYLRGIVNNTEAISLQNFEIDTFYFMLSTGGMILIIAVSFLMVFINLVRAISKFRDSFYLATSQEVSAKATSDNLQFIELITRILLKIDIPDISKKYKHISLFESNKSTQRKEKAYFTRTKCQFFSAFFGCAFIFGSFLLICHLFQMKNHKDMISSINNFNDNAFVLRSQTKLVLLLDSFVRLGLINITDTSTNLDMFIEESNYYKNWFNLNLNDFESFFPFYTDQLVCDVARDQENCQALSDKYIHFRQPIPKFFGLFRLTLEDQLLCSMRARNMTDFSETLSLETSNDKYESALPENCTFVHDYLRDMRGLFMNFYLENREQIVSAFEFSSSSYTKLGSFTFMLLITFCVFSGVIYFIAVFSIQRIIKNIEDLHYLEHFFGSRFLSNILSALISA